MTFKSLTCIAYPADLTLYDSDFYRWLKRPEPYTQTHVRGTFIYVGNATTNNNNHHLIFSMNF